MAHDLGNLLTVVQSGLGLLQLDPRMTPDLLEEIEIIADATQRGARLTGSMRDLTRLDAVEGGMALEAHLLQLEPLLVHLLEGRFLTMRTPESGRRIALSAEQFDRVLINLVVNAARASAPHTSIEVVADTVELDAQWAMRLPQLQPGTYVRVLVIDQGCGMSPEVCEQCTEPFFTTRPDAGGTGLGLATCAAILSAADGALWIESEEGVGTTVSLWLPLLAEEPLQQSA